MKRRRVYSWLPFTPCTLHDVIVRLCAICGLSLFAWSAPFAFDRTVESGGGKIHIYIEDDNYKLTSIEMINWVHRASDIVSGYYGRFPVDEAYVAISGQPGKGVLNGIALGEGGAVVNVKIGVDSDRKDLDDDWILIHELIHLAFPKVHTRHHWIEEGLSVYVEATARAQSGDIAAERVWSSFHQGMPNGLPQPGDQGLDNTPTWGRIYWGGALFFLLADMEIIARSKGQKSLKQGLRGITDAGFNISMQSNPGEMFRIADEAVGFSVLTDLYQQMSTLPVDVDLDEIWQALGVMAVSDGVVLSDNAERAHIRRKITRPANDVTPQ